MYLIEGKEKIIIVWQLFVQIELKIIFDFISHQLSNDQGLKRYKRLWQCNRRKREVTEQLKTVCLQFEFFLQYLSFHRLESLVWIIKPWNRGSNQTFIFFTAIWICVSSLKVFASFYWAFNSTHNYCMQIKISLFFLHKYRYFHFFSSIYILLLLAWEIFPKKKKNENKF